MPSSDTILPTLPRGQKNTRKLCLEKQLTIRTVTWQGLSFLQQQGRGYKFRYRYSSLLHLLSERVLQRLTAGDGDARIFPSAGCYTDELAHHFPPGRGRIKEIDSRKTTQSSFSKNKVSHGKALCSLNWLSPNEVNNNLLLSGHCLVRLVSEPDFLV